MDFDTSSGGPGGGGAVGGFASSDNHSAAHGYNNNFISLNGDIVSNMNTNGIRVASPSNAMMNIAARTAVVSVSSLSSLDVDLEHNPGPQAPSSGHFSLRMADYLHTSAALTADDEDGSFIRRNESTAAVAWNDDSLTALFGFIPVTLKTYLRVWEILWIVVLASWSANITFFFPSYPVPSDDPATSVNLTTMIQNFIGAFVLGIISALQIVKYQYTQKYLFYGGVKSGWASVWTTFATFTQDSGRLLLNGAWGTLALWILGQLAGSFIAWELGRKAVFLWKKDARFANQVRMLEHDDHRMAFEIEKEVLKSTPSGRMEDGLRVRLKGMDFQNTGDSLHRRLRKRIKHSSPFLSKGQKILFSAICLLGYGSYFLVFAIYPDQVGENSIFFLFSLVWSVLGVLTGWKLGDNRGKKHTVLWGTFRVNLMSAIFIGAAYNILLFRHSLGSFGDWNYFLAFVGYFSTSFCGSESSFGGLIDGTMLLWHAPISKWVAVKNLLFNLFVCLLVFLAVFALPRVFWVLQTTGIGSNVNIFF